jgi:hypothetical protein
MPIHLSFSYPPRFKKRFTTQAACLVASTLKQAV